MRSNSDRISVQLLGPFAAALGQQSVAPSAAKQRQILALLALNAGRVVTVSTLADELWGECPPRRSATALQTYILHLRNRLAAARPGGRRSRELIGTRHSGYLLDASACETDVEEFERLACLGRQAAEAGDHRATAELLGQALALWRGPALVDVPSGRVLELEAASLQAQRLGVLERRIEADLALRRHADLVGELTLLVARNPMNENFCGLLMTALYRSGHAGRALEAFRRLRAALREELGLEPCPRLRQLQQAVLSGDPGLDADELMPGAASRMVRH
ncbi:MAG TPA: AfsR/SARP family transcriptional regulator [Streptosporangiaceae bacterium]|nr:AfsR/SARP family transcriptional regulator [Streptosporangiaceae bacterium]